MSQFLHDLGLLQEGLGRHGAWLQGLDGHLSGTIPGACITVGEQTCVGGFFSENKYGIIL